MTDDEAGVEVARTPRAWLSVYNEEGWTRLR
jgi:hypothetical protein